MKNKQQKEIEVLEYFCPVKLEGDVDSYFLKSEKGMGIMPESFRIAKSYRDFHIKMYKQDWKHGTFWFIEAKEEFPPVVFEFLCKSILGFIPTNLK